MIITIFDTETTGLQDPGLMQLGALQIEVKDGIAGATELQALNVLVKPEKPREIHPKAYEAHGISMELCEKLGVSLSTALDMLEDMIDASDILMAYNYKFDQRVIANVCKDVGKSFEPMLGTTKTHCAMLPMTNICQIPNATNSSFKWPKLEEAYRYCFKREMENAHDAMADVRATKEVFLWWTENKNNVS